MPYVHPPTLQERRWLKWRALHSKERASNFVLALLAASKTTRSFMWIDAAKKVRP